MLESTKSDLILISEMMLFLLFFRMFTESCKRLRIMKSSEAIGLGKINVCYIKISTLLHACMIPSYFLSDSCILLFLQHLEPWRSVKVATSAMQCASCILIRKDRRSHLLSIKYLLACLCMY